MEREPGSKILERMDLRDGYARKKKKPSTDDGQLFIKVALRSNVFHRPNFASGPPLRLRSRPNIRKCNIMNRILLHGK